MIAFIDEHKDSTAGGLRWGVAPMCTVLSEHGITIVPSPGGAVLGLASLGMLRRRR